MMFFYDIVPTHTQYIIVNLEINYTTYTNWQSADTKILIDRFKCFGCWKSMFLQFDIGIYDNKQ